MFHVPPLDEQFAVGAQGVLSTNLANSLSILTHSFNKYLLRTHSMQDIILGTRESGIRKGQTMATAL